MRKVFRVISAPFIWIWKIIDKLIIVNITKIFLKARDFWSDNNKTLEAWLFKTNNLIIIALILSFSLFFLVNNRAIQLTRNNADVLQNQRVTAIYNSERYVVEGIPETVDITLIGSSSDLFLAKQLPPSDIKVDLTGLSEGTHRVNLTYTQTLGNVQYNIDPSVITVIISSKESAVKTVTTDLLHQDSLDPKLYISNIELEQDQVVVKGSAERLEEVAQVRAMIDARALNDPTVGTMSADEIRLVAFDRNGRRVNVEIVPRQISAELTITSPSKEVPVRVIPEGDVAFGRAITTMNSNVTRVTVYGSEAALENLHYVPVRINVRNLNADREFNVQIAKPTGVRYISSNNATVNVTLGREATKEIDNVFIEYQNLASGLTIQAATERDTRVSVILTGSRTVLDNLDPTTVTAYVDLRGYGRGTHTVRVRVIGEDLRIRYQPTVSTVTLRIR